MHAQTKFKNCWQNTATDTVILIDDQINEASASSGELAARDVALIAKGHLEQEHLPTHERSWRIFPYSRDLRGNAQSGQENVIVLEHNHGDNTSRLFEKTTRTYSKD